MFQKKMSVALLIMIMSAFTACGQQQNVEVEEYTRQESSAIEEDNNTEEEKDTQETENGETEAVLDTGEKNTEIVEEETVVLDEEEVARIAEMKAMFGEHCIAEQTFEVELSEYDGKVYVVPFTATADESRFHIKIIQNGEVLETIRAYIPEELEGEVFVSLDSISFFDANFDDCTDIVTIQTYGNTSLVTVKYGFAKNADEYYRRFNTAYDLSDWLTASLEKPTIPEIRRLVTQGKKNGEFTSYQEAYETRSHLCELENNSEMTYDLIYFDEDDVPELVAGVSGYRVSLYTYCDGRLYTLMDDWPYGAAGNHGYEYAPKKNNLRNYNTDYAGLILYTTYMSVNKQFELEAIAQIETFNFDDANGNGMPDEEERGSVGEYSVSYLNGVEVTSDECAVYDMGDYDYIHGSMNYEELLQVLKK